jgi:hypothetical protein
MGVRKARPVATHRLQQAEGAHDVGFDEVAWAVDGAVHMAFGRKVHHRAGLVFGQQARDQRGVANVALHKHVVRVALQAGEGFGVAGVGELVEVDNGLIVGREPVEDEIGADEAGTTCDKDGHGSESKNADEGLRCLILGAKARLAG